MKIVVTGGAGFIGSHIAKALVNRGDQVKIIDNLSTGLRSNLESVLDKVEFIEGDICNVDLLRQEFRGFDYVLHQAGIGSVPKSIDDPLTVHRNNTVGTLNVLVAAKDSGIKRVVYASSCAIYGDGQETVKFEDLPARPLSPYALGKYTGELYCQLFYKLYGLESICLRYFNVFGPNQPAAGVDAAVIPQFVHAITHKPPLIIYGDGEQGRDFVYVSDVVQANILALTSPTANGEAINIASGYEVTLKRLAQEISQRTAQSTRPLHQPARPGDIQRSCADIGKAKLLLGYCPKTSLGVGIDQTIAWHRSVALPVSTR